jgi:hypothetical protein
MHLGEVARNRLNMTLYMPSHVTGYAYIVVTNYGIYIVYTTPEVYTCTFIYILASCHQQVPAPDVLW